MKLIIIYIPKTIRWHCNCNVTLLFLLLLCCPRRKPKAKDTKEDNTKPLDSCERKCAGNRWYSSTTVGVPLQNLVSP